MPSTPLYALRPAEVFAALESCPAGLGSAEVEARLSLYGPNALREPRVAATARYKVLLHVVHPMALLLWGAGLVAFVGGRPLLGVVIWLVVIVNALFSLIQEYRAQQAITSLKKLLPAYARVLRNGAEAQIPASQVTPGDVLVLAEGDYIPADARVVEEYGLRVNQATLTGEAMPARKNAEASLREGITEVEHANLVFAGTSVVAGTGRAVVYGTGMLTQFGRIANLTQAVTEEPSRLQLEMRQLTRRIAVVAGGLGAVVIFVGITEVGLDWAQAVLLATGIIVAVIPEGLAPTVTLALAMAVQRLAAYGVLVKKLSTMETLGTVSVICTDKSGTLTQNQMTVREVWTGRQRFSVTGVGYEPSGAFEPPLDSVSTTDLRHLLVAAALCNNARLTPPAPGHPQWTCLGDQTEAALRVLARKGAIDERMLDSLYPRVHELPFDARRKRMSTVHRETAGEVVFVKGAPKEVLQLCTSLMVAGEPQPLTNALRAEILAMNDEYARNALRVLALATRSLPRRPGGNYTPENVEQELTFLGLVAMMDPPRPEVAAAMQTCRTASIRLVMITGDYGLTAESVARRIGMLTTPNPLILTGGELDGLGEAELQRLLEKEVVFARMAPEHKLRLVAAFQARGEVVAVIGDGVNDAPALRKADIGLAMGVTGTDVAKEAADVILTDDDFADVAHAIEEGRAVYDNLRKFVTYIFASNVPEVMSFVVAALFKLPLALTVAQILAIDMGSDLFPALALGTEKPEPGVMRRPPRRRGQPLIDRRLLIRALVWLGGLETLLCFAGFFGVYFRAGYTNWQGLADADNLTYMLATTMFHAGVVMAQIGTAFACRTGKDRVRALGWFSNRFLLLGIAIETLIIGMLIYVPWLARLFEHAPLPLEYWLGLAAYPVSMYGLEWLRKQFLRWRDTRLKPPEAWQPG